MEKVTKELNAEPVTNVDFWQTTPCIKRLKIKGVDQRLLSFSSTIHSLISNQKQQKYTHS